MKDDSRTNEAEIIRFPERGGMNGLAPVVGQVVFLPLTMMLYGLNLLARTARAVPAAAGAPERARRLPPAPPQSDPPRDPPQVAAPSGWASLPPTWTSPESAGRLPTLPPSNVGVHQPQGGEEQRRMMDNKSLQDDMLKTVRYWVSFEKRGYETVLYEKIGQVYDNLTDAQFTAWKMAEFMKRLADGAIEMPDAPTGRAVPLKPSAADARKLGEIDPDDRRYLALDWEVVGRVPRRRGWFDERKTEALEEIADKLTAPRFVRVDVGD